MLDRFIKRMEEGLEAMSRSAESGRLRDARAAAERLGRLQEKNWRASGCFDVTIEEKKGSGGEGGKLSITWVKDERSKRDLCGCYLVHAKAGHAR